MKDKVSTEKIWINPYVIAIIGIIILYATNFAPITFVMTGFIYGILSKQIIKFKTLLKFAFTFSIIQLIINAIIIAILERSYFLFAPEIYLKKYLGYFALSLVLGSIIFLITNLIIFAVFKLIEKFSKPKNEE